MWKKSQALPTVEEEEGLRPLPLPLTDSSRPLPMQGGEEGLRPIPLHVKSFTIIPCPTCRGEMPTSIRPIALSLSFHTHVYIIGSHVTFCQWFFNNESKET